MHAELALADRTGNLLRYAAGGRSDTVLRPERIGPAENLLGRKRRQVVDVTHPAVLGRQVPQAGAGRSPPKPLLSAWGHIAPSLAAGAGNLRPPFPKLRPMPSPLAMPLGKRDVYRRPSLSRRAMYQAAVALGPAVRQTVKHIRPSQNLASRQFRPAPRSSADLSPCHRPPPPIAAVSPTTLKRPDSSEIQLAGEGCGRTWDADKG